jgi:hypothetical protein
MLSKKYYAQRGHSSRPMNTSAVAGSGFTSLKHKKNIFAFGTFYGPEQNRKTSGIHTQIIAQNTSGCVKTVPYSENNVVLSSCYRRPNIGTVMNVARKVCFIHKDWPVRTAEQQVVLERHLRSCPANDPVPINNVC